QRKPDFPAGPKIQIRPIQQRQFLSAARVLLPQTLLKGAEETHREDQNFQREVGLLPFRFAQERLLQLISQQYQPERVGLVLRKKISTAKHPPKYLESQEQAVVLLLPRRMQIALWLNLCTSRLTLPEGQR